MKFSSTYLDWLKSEITEEDLGNGYTEITAPFLDIQIYIQALTDGMYRISDDMYTITDLKMSGLDFKTPKRKQILQDIVRKRGIELDSKKDELYLTVPKSNLGEAQHQLFQAMLDINDLFYLNQSSIKSFFFEDVTNYFDSHEIYYSKDISLRGRSGYTQNFDFLLQRNKLHPERFIKLLNNPRRSHLERFSFSWTDIKEQRGEEGKFIVLINDQDKSIDTHIAHLKEYDIQGIPWSKKNEYQEVFA